MSETPRDVFAGLVRECVWEVRGTRDEEADATAQAEWMARFDAAAGGSDRMPAVAAAHPCAPCIGMDRAVEFTAEGRTGIACIGCRWWVTDVSTVAGPREFSHTQPIVRNYDDMVTERNAKVVYDALTTTRGIAAGVD